MKRILSLSFVVCFLACLATNCILAQSRESKDIKILVKNAPRTNAFQFAVTVSVVKQSYYDFVSLKDIDQAKLNSTEKELLKTFTDVAFCFNGSKVHCCYWVKDADGKIGLMKLDGSILVPPLKGNIYHCTLPSRVVVGEQTIKPSDWGNEYCNRVLSHTGLGLGHFGAVVDDIRDEKKIRATIPAGKYDDIMLGLKGSHTYYFVAKLIDGEMKWGVVDKNDKEVMPIEAKGIYKKKGSAQWLIGNIGGKWAASETMDMSQIENMVLNEEAMAQQRRDQLAVTLMALGGALQNTAVAIEQIQNNGNGTSSYGSASASGESGSLTMNSSGDGNARNGAQPSSTSNGNKYNLGEQQSYDTAMRSWEICDSQLSAHFEGGRAATRNEVKQWQQNMKDLREKWKAKGKSFPNPYNENRSTSDCPNNSHSH